MSTLQTDTIQIPPSIDLETRRVFLDIIDSFKVDFKVLNDKIESLEIEIKGLKK